MKKKLSVVYIFLILMSFSFSACSSVSDVTLEDAPEVIVETVVEEPAETADLEEEVVVEEEITSETEDVGEEEVEADVSSSPEEFSWTQDYIKEVPPLMMIDPYFQIFGQSQEAVPYHYETAVKLAGHSCGATAGAWEITRKALEVLYPDGEIPVRGQIAVEASGAEDEWHVGVFGEVITFLTGASPKTGFIGAEFGQTDDKFVRQNKMTYAEEPTGQMPPQREWIFTRLDTGAKVGVKYNLAVITPIATEERQAMGKKMAAGEATPEEAEDYIRYWNERAKFVFEYADTLDGFFTVTVYEEPPLTTSEAIEDTSAQIAPDEFEWDQDYIAEVPPLMMKEPYFEIFGQAEGPVPYYYEEAVKLAGHSCGATTGAWVITQKALEVLYPDGETPVRGQIMVEAPGAEDEWFVGVFGEIITFLTGAAPHTGFSGVEFAEADETFLRRNKMVYAEEPTKQLPPRREWVFTRLDTGTKVGVRFNLVVIKPLPTPFRVSMGKKMAAGEASPEEAADYIQYWNDRARFVLENADMDGFFTVTVYE
ncbi:MAG: hypothetical protein U5K99_00290 [Anaerolineales bacterium]|nr:hypothetical protein [Anaerolineales bacterium]